MGFRLIVGSDEAGYDYKEIIKADLEASGRVDSVVDVGVVRDARAPYPKVAIEAAERIANGEETVPSSSAAPDSASRSRRTRCAASAP